MITASSENAVSALRNAEELFWINPLLNSAGIPRSALSLGINDITDAQQRLIRFAPLIERLFPYTAASGGIIESDLTPVPALQQSLAPRCRGKLYIKQDNTLPIAGSIKARGGIYEVLKHTEALALEGGILCSGSDYSKLADYRDFFSQFTIQVGSTGNLGLSVGIMSATLGYHAVVHMSSDAMQWKKDLLRKHGAEVVEYSGSYTEAVLNGRRASEASKQSYFIDDENSPDLFLGYAVAALRLKEQLERRQIAVDAEHPLYVYLPCGVGGAPGGITFGLKLLFGEFVRCYIIEPVNAPCMTAAIASGKGTDMDIGRLGLSGLTAADGLAVGRASALAYEYIKDIIDGCITVHDDKLIPALISAYKTEGIFMEPSAAASLCGFSRLCTPEALQYLSSADPLLNLDNAVHIAWATGGSLVPESERRRLIGGLEP